MHLAPDAPVLSRRGLMALAVAGGILPSPTALVVLLSAVSFQRVAFGLALIAMFSVGLAASLIVVGLLALGSLTACLILVLDGAMPNWLAALVVGLAYAAVAGVLYLVGKQRVEDAGSPIPEQTVETLKEDVQWAKHPTTSAKT